MEDTYKYLKPFTFDLQLFAGEKTEEPTAKRMGDAIKKGNFARSQELGTTMTMFAGFYALSKFGRGMYEDITGFMAYVLSNPVFPATQVASYRLFIDVAWLFVGIALPLMGLVLLFGIVTNLAQIGFHFSTYNLGFKLSRLNPIAGFQRLLSIGSRLAALIKCLAKLVIIGFFVYQYLKDEIPYMPQYLYMDLRASLPMIADIIIKMIYQVITVIFIMSLCDYAYNKYKHKQGLKMSKDEVKEEFKQQEGDPKIKGKIRQKQREMAMARMMQEVPTADVVVTNPTHFAVALKYDPGMEAPLVVAKGADYVAFKIRTIAKEAGVAIVENKPLARALYAMVEVGRQVPPELYKAVAEVLAYVYRMKRKFKAA